MKIRAENPITALPPGPRDALHRLRRRRGFQAGPWAEAKALAVAHYLRQAGLSGTVLGVSGGIDSAVAAALLARVAALPDSPLRRLELLSLPAHRETGVTGQAEASVRALDVARSVGRPLRQIDLSVGVPALRAVLGTQLGAEAKPWAAGQGVAVARTLALYQAAAVLTQEGNPALVVGTTNRDEGAYLGYVGKAADGMVDLQILSDLHKSEVFAVAEVLGVPDSVRQAEPTGDMFDACPDTEVFGAPYDAVELLLLARTLWTPEEWTAERAEWTPTDQALWAHAEANLEALHGYNAHKYLVGSPAVHLDLFDSAVQGGWRPAVPEPWAAPSTVVSERPAPRALPTGDRRVWHAPSPDGPRLADTHGMRIHIPGLLTPTGRTALLEALNEGPWQAADAHGQWRGRVPDRSTSSNGGSWRTTAEDPAWAAALWDALRDRLPAFRRWSPHSRFDGADAPVWRPVGINPVFRFIRYEAGGWLVPHYDGPFPMGQRRRTGMTLVLYLESAKGAGGELRFLHDPQAHLPLGQCVFADGEAPPSPEQVAHVAATYPGDAWLFDHWQLHDSALLVRGRKTLVRTDVIFERVGP